MEKPDKILIIDDEDSVRMSYVAHFEDYGYQVYSAKNGKEGIEVFQKEKPSIVITDMRMPEMDGLGVLYWFKNNNPEIPVIIVSGAGDINLVVEALRLGAWDYIIKPITNLSMLTYAITNSLEKAKLMRENIQYREHLEELVQERTEKLEKTNRALNESEKKYKLLADNVADVIWLIDEDLNINYVSPSIKNLSGYSVDEYKKLQLSQIYSGESFGIIRDFLMSEISKNKNGKSSLELTHKFETEMNRKDGSRLWVENKVKFIRDAGSNSISVLGISRDVTERKIYEEELKIAKDFAEENDRLKTAFLNNMSHEIRTPLNVIQGYVGLLLEDFKENDLVREYTQPIIRNSEQLLKIIDDILNISIIETGQINVNMSKFNVNNLIEHIIQEQNLRATQKKLKLEFENRLAQNHAEIVSDIFKVKQILNNLITNGLKYTEKGFVRISVEVNENKIIFSVEDSGIGIDKKNFDKIFGRFQRVELTDDNTYHSLTHGGTGLGLSICKGLLDVLGGKIWLESKLGVGSKFYFSLPANKSAN